MLFEDLPDAVISEEMLEMVPTSKVILSSDKVPEEEYDILVTFAESTRSRASSLHVLSFGATSAGDGVVKPSDRSFLSRDVSTLAHELAIPPGIPSAMVTLLKASVIPHIPEGRKDTWRLARPTQFYVETIADSGDLMGHCIPLVHVGARQDVSALLMKRLGKLSLLLPSETQQHVAWLRLFLDLVGDVDSESVPPDLEWKTSERWSPPEVSERMHELETLRREHEEAVVEFQRREQATEALLKESGRRADEGTRRVLTHDGVELVEAVTTVLEDLGFEVRDMDDHHDQRTGAKLEDLRVEDPSAPEWLCLVEIKGYLKGAKVNDVSQITGRPAVAYTKETGQEPPGVWHIVNAWRDTSPANRVTAVPNDDDLRPLTDAGGALIDTRDLYEAWRDVTAGIVEAEFVRATLREAKTRWSWASKI